MPMALVGAVIIGRNEGPRLESCLDSVKAQTDMIVYVDSGSTDGSVTAAHASGTHVVELDPTVPFTAARARNTGVTALSNLLASPHYVQFIDGDCELQPGWLERATAALTANPSAAVVCGRRREKFPDATPYNRLIDKEWDTQTGQTSACGGDALMRLAAFNEVGGFNPDLIAGEEPELCLRLRGAGWEIWRIDAEMTSHDAAISRFSQWWARNRRAGHAFAEGAALYGHLPERYCVRETLSASVWAASLPVLALACAFISPWFFTLLLGWPLQILRLSSKSRDFRWGFFLILGKLPEAQGILGYWLGRLRGARAHLIEYK